MIINREVVGKEKGKEKNAWLNMMAYAWVLLIYFPALSQPLSVLWLFLWFSSWVCWIWWIAGAISVPDLLALPICLHRFPGCLLPQVVTNLFYFSCGPLHISSFLFVHCSPFSFPGPGVVDAETLLKLQQPVASSSEVLWEPPTDRDKVPNEQ